MRPAVRVEGARELRAHLEDIGGKDLLDELKDAHRKVSNLVVDAARPLAPARSGALRASIRPLASRREARVRANALYAAAIHWGRKVGNVGSPPGNRMGANPITGRRFLWDAADKVRDDAVAVYEDDLTDLINRKIDS